MTTKEKIDEIFKNSKDQVEAIIAIYSLFFPDWDNIETIDNYPTMGKEISNHIWSSFIEFDKLHHPTVMPGGLWLNKGFATSETLKGWEVDLSTCKVYYKVS